MSFDPGLILLGLLLVSIYLSIRGNRNANPLLGIANRWLRWVLFSLALAWLVQDMGWSNRPFWLLAVTAFLVWFLAETMYNWLVINALSKSPIPLFPKFQTNESGDEWPNQRSFIKLRDWLRRNGFKQLQSLKAPLMDDFSLRSTVFEDEPRLTRLQVLFLPQRGGDVGMSAVVHSQTRGGIRLITDNVNLPYGGFYPSDWHLVRKPLTRSVERLVKIHRKRLARLKDDEPLPFEKDLEPVHQINDQQRTLEQCNVEQGFLIPRQHQEEFGRISREGRYRLWKEIWLLNYFGIPLAH